MHRTSPKAILSLILGLASMACLCFTGLPAIVLGLLALRDIRRQGRQLKGFYLAIAGIATGILFGIGAVLVVLSWLPGLIAAH